MRRLLAVFAFLGLVLGCGKDASDPDVTANPSNTPARSLRPSADVAPAVVLDPDILAMVAQVDSDRIASDIQTLVGFETRNTCSDNSGTAPGIGAARDWIQSQFAALPGVAVRLDPWTYAGCGDSRTLHNVIAWIPGTGNPNRLIVIGGHYDSRNTSVTDGVNPAPGSNDSGSQTALVLEVARVMSGYTFDATVLFATWSGEEQGLRGSAAFVNGNYREYFPEGTPELNFTADIVGGDNTVNDLADLQQFRLYSPGTPREISSLDGRSDDTSPSRGVMRHVGYWGGLYVPTMLMLPKLREDRVNRGSDHKSFIGRGIPGVRFIDVNENLAHQHSPNDLHQFVTPSYTARVAQVVAASAASLARASTPPDSMVARRLPSDSVTLTWTAPAAGPAVDHYVISARAVSNNLYRTRVVVPGAALSATVSLIEDLGIVSGVSSYISVAAVDAQGHESLYAYPEYRCSSWSCNVPSGSLNVTATR